MENAAVSMDEAMKSAWRVTITLIELNKGFCDVIQGIILTKNKKQKTKKKTKTKNKTKKKKTKKKKKQKNKKK